MIDSPAAIDRETALVLVALELESPALGSLNRRIVALGGQPIPAREPWLTEARKQVRRRSRRQQKEVAG